MPAKTKRRTAERHPDADQPGPAFWRKLAASIERGRKASSAPAATFSNAQIGMFIDAMERADALRGDLFAQYLKMASGSSSRLLERLETIAIALHRIGPTTRDRVAGDALALVASISKSQLEGVCAALSDSQGMMLRRCWDLAGRT